MNKIKDQLKTIAKSLTGLSRQIEKISKQADKLSFTKKTIEKKRAIRKNPKKRKAVKAFAVKIAGKSMPKNTVLDLVLAVINRSKKGASIDTIRKKTNLGPRQLSNALYKLSKRDLVEAKSRGLYIIK